MACLHARPCTGKTEPGGVGVGSTHLGGRERQGLDRCALGGEAVAGVHEGQAGAVLRDGGQGDAPLLLPLEHRGRRANAQAPHFSVGGNGDQLTPAATAQVGDGVAVQAVLCHAGPRVRGLAGRWHLLLLWWLRLLGAAADTALCGRLLGEVKFTQVTPSIGVLPREGGLGVTVITLLLNQLIQGLIH